MNKFLLPIITLLCACSALAQNNRPEHIYIIGTLNEDNSYDLGGREFTTEDYNVYTCNEVRIYNDRGVDHPYIIITETPPPATTPKICYINDAEVNLKTNPFESTVTRVSREIFAQFVMPKAGLYDFKLDFTGITDLTGCHPKITISEVQTGPTTSVENVAIGNSPAVYYNLQGCKVDNPASGTYIVVKDGKAKKVFIQ